MAATMILDTDGRVLEATLEALDLLGVTLQEVRSLPPGAFSADPPDPEADAAFRSTWEDAGRPDIGGTATLRRPDATLVRVRFAITARDDGRFLAVLDPVEAPVEAPPTVYTAGTILPSWRAAERRLAEVADGSDEWAAINAEIDQLRTRYQDLFRSRSSSGGT